MKLLRSLLLFASWGHAHLLGIPTVPFNVSSDGTYNLRKVHRVVVDIDHEYARDESGLTTIPPTLWEFAETFLEDLATIGIAANLVHGRKAEVNSIFFTLDDDKAKFRDTADRETSEGYSLSVTSSGITISGASPLGVWWGSRTLLQQALLSDNKLKIGSGLDAPGWSERGMMLDVARHYYPAEFLAEMCAYLSFFKQNVFHLHLSDHVWDPAKLFSHDLALELYAAFRPASEDPSVEGLARPVNETYRASVLDQLQRKCARRGVTILPELESPGHSIATTDWRPEIALSDFSMLNLSRPETLTTVKAYWKALIDNFHSKIVHIGADEYDSNYVDEYTGFVNAMHSYIREISGKSIRIWGTFAPSAEPDAINIDKEVTIQQWSSGQDNGLADFIDKGYTLVNSDDYFYLDVKYSDGGVYPSELDIERVFNGAPDGGAFAPNILDPVNSTNNPPRSSPNILGHLAVVWNDWGPNASTCHEAYHMVRNGLPALADKQWGGVLKKDEYADIFKKLQPAIPGQNLDLRIESRGPTVLSYNFQDSSHTHSSTVKDSSGNRYNGQLKDGASVRSGTLHLDGQGYLQTPLTSKGRNYTLSFSVKPHGHGGALFSGPDSSFLNGNGSSPYLMLVSGNIAYPVNITLPNGQWSDLALVGAGPQTFVRVGGTHRETRVEEVTITMGIWGGYMQEAPMAIAAPVARIGEGFTGQMKVIKLMDEASV